MKRLLYDVLAAHQLWVESDGELGEKADLRKADLVIDKAIRSMMAEEI